MNIEAMRARLAEIQSEYDSINEQLMSEEVLKDPREVTRLSRAQARLTALVEARARFLIWKPGFRKRRPLNMKATRNSA